MRHAGLKNESRKRKTGETVNMEARKALETEKTL